MRLIGNKKPHISGLDAVDSSRVDYIESINRVVQMTRIYIGFFIFEILLTIRRGLADYENYN